MFSTRFMSISHVYRFSPRRDIPAMPGFELIFISLPFNWRIASQLDLFFNVRISRRVSFDVSNYVWRGVLSVARCRRVACLKSLTWTVLCIILPSATSSIRDWTTKKSGTADRDSVTFMTTQHLRVLICSRNLSTNSTEAIDEDERQRQASRAG